MADGPMVVLSDESQRTSGEDARSMNLEAGRAVAETIRTTLGPRGMDKMLVDQGGNVVVTNDGVTLLEEMDVDHPAADMVVDVATTQEEEVGDGTTSAVILAGALLGNAEELLEQDIHPTSIVAGYRHAAETVTEVFEDIATEVDPDDTEVLEQVAGTAMTGKGAETAKDLLSSMVVSAVRAAVREDGTVDQDAVDVRQFYGASIDDSEFVDGILFDIEPVHQNMSRDLDDANVLVYEGDIEVSETEVGAEASVGDMGDLQGFVEREQSELADKVDAIVEAGADVVLADGGIDEYAAELLVENGITAFRRVDDDKRQRVAAATGAERVGDLKLLTADHLGHAGSVSERVIRDVTVRRQADHESTVVFGDLPEEGVGTILLRGGTEHVLDEVERAVVDSIGVVSAAIEDGYVLPGGGAPEIEASLALREEADSVEGREQLAVEAFAEAFEDGPRTLAENAGHDAIDALVDMTARHDAGDVNVGIDADTGELVEMFEDGVVEPLRVKTTAVNSAVDASTMILRIDDVISAGDLSVGGEDEDEGGAGGPPGGMGGMGGGMGGMM
ncbi:thermosome subunit alpha [Halosimplex pelagicum]|uniref:Thermosome subunit n=1 Tax=Halosimplex pelagicum TaxID=869886 RepID=A0A7D5TWP3_9EURY|nr:thermosome subunit alpha [Halosimplex pelagicum]QLH85052.1 thermosome subunit [Halosimplex pelagicum]